MNNIKRGPGRPRQYENKAEQMRAQRTKMKQAGYHAIHAFIPEEYKKLMGQACISTDLSISELICYLLECARKHEIADIDKPIDFKITP